MTSPTVLPARVPWFKRRTFAVGAVTAGLALAGMGTVMHQASAQPVDSKIAATCALGTGTIDVSVPLTVDDKMDPVAAGASEVLVTNTGLPELPVEATINKLVVTTPVPAQIGSIDSVTFSGGNMKSSYSVTGSDLIVTFTGPVSSKTIQVPTVTANLTVRADAAGTIAWKPFSEVDADTNYGLATCKPNDPNQAVNTTAVTAGTTPTSTGPKPTSSTPPSTSPSTTVPAKSTPAKSTPAKPTEHGVSGSARIDVTVEGSNRGTVGSAPSVPNLPGKPSVPTPPVPALPTPPAPTLPTPATPAIPALPTSAPSLPVPTGACPSTPTLPVTLPAPAVPCPAMPATPKAPAIPAPGISGSVSGTVKVTW